MSNEERTVVALKSSFLRTQIRILSQPLQPSQRWRDNSRQSGTLTDGAIADATREGEAHVGSSGRFYADTCASVNRQLRRHTKAAYSSLAVRHVAEQIDQLYWDAAAPDVDVEDFDDPEDGILRVGDDLTSAASIEQLTDTWEFDSETTISAKQRADRDAYEEACRKLKALSEKRENTLKNLRALQQLKSTLQHFEDPQRNVQANLVTKDGKLAEELTRCKELSVRVSARMGALEKEDRIPFDNENDSRMDSQKRLKRAWDAT